MARRVLAAGHVCLDLIPLAEGPGGVEPPLPGRLARVGPLAAAPGGSVSNTGLALGKFGLDVRFVGRLGGDLPGRWLREILASPAGEESLRLSAAPGEHTSYTVILGRAGGERSFLHHPGANTSFREEDVSQEDLGWADHLHLGYPPLLPSLLERDGEPLARLLERASERGCSTSVDMVMVDAGEERKSRNWKAVFRKFLPFVDFFMPSLEELEALLEPDRFLARGKNALASYTEKNVESLAGRCLEWGAGAVAVKMGERGLALFTRRGPAPLGGDPAWSGLSLRVPAITPRRVAGTTGAGDAAVAGFLAAFLEGAGPGKCLRCAASAGSFCVEAPDAQSAIPSWRGILERARLEGN